MSTLIVPPLLVIIAVLILKIVIMRHSMSEIADELSEKLSGDTNTLISVSSSDRYVRKLAAGLNRELAVLRRERLRYEKGDARLRASIMNVSHDLRTPLTAISGYLDLLEDEEKSGSAGKYLAVIRERTDEMRSLCEEFFSYSIASASLMPENNAGMVETDLRDIHEQSLAGAYASFVRRGIVPEISMPEEKVIRNVDRTPLRRIFDNILSNAQKYSEGDLSVTLTPGGLVTFENSARLGQVDAKRLFDRFFTVETAKNSTGLGLSIAKTLTEAMGGSIGADYNNGRLCIYLRFET